MAKNRDAANEALEPSRRKRSKPQRKATSRVRGGKPGEDRPKTGADQATSTWGKLEGEAEAEASVSTPSTGTWSNITRETNELFSCSRKYMIRKCAIFAARTRGM